MANPHKGEVSLVAGDITHKLSLSVNAICELEDLMNEPVSKIASRLNDPETVRMKTIRALVWAALLDHKPEVTLKDAGAVISAAGIPETMAAIGKAFEAAFPAVPAKDDEASDDARPSRAKAG